MNTYRKDGRSCASCARGICTSMYGTKNAKDCFEYALPFFAFFASLRRTFLFQARRLNHD